MGILRVAAWLAATEVPLSQATPTALAQKPDERVVSRKQARREVRLTAILERIASGEDVADATRAVYFDPATTPYTRSPACVRPRSYWVGTFNRLVAETSPGLLDSAKHAALARLAGDSDVALKTLGSMARGDFPRKTKEDIGAAREQREAAQFILEAIGAGPKRFAGITANVNTQVNTFEPGEELRRQKAAEVIAGTYRVRRVEDDIPSPATTAPEAPAS